MRGPDEAGMLHAEVNPANKIHGLVESWAYLKKRERLAALSPLARGELEDLFLALSPRRQSRLLLDMPAEERRSLMRLLPPQDAAHLIQETASPDQPYLLGLLDDVTRHETGALLAYRADAAGGLMNPRFIRLRPDATVDQAITYLRQQLGQVKTVYYAYVLDEDQHLRGVISLKDLVTAPAERLVRDVMTTDLCHVAEDTDHGIMAKLLSEWKIRAVPVIDSDGRMKGIVAGDDIADIVREEESGDMQKLGGMAALDDSYLETGFWAMLRKRAGWLVVLFIGEMLTATAMAHYEHQIEAAVVLALFVPLIISSGGNSGSQATTLIIRAMALGELRLRDWFLVVRRELMAGVALGALLGTVGFIRIVVWQYFGHVYGEYYLLLAWTIGCALLGVVSFGALAGAMLPFILRRCGVDPASASAPFVATLVDVSGLIIYFTIAKAILTGTLL